MKTKTPGFDAEKSLYRTGRHYKTGSGKSWIASSRKDSRVRPQGKVQPDYCAEICLLCAWHPIECVACALCLATQ